MKKHLLIQVLLDVDGSVIHENMIKAEPDSQGYAQSVVRPHFVQKVKLWIYSIESHVYLTPGTVVEVQKTQLT